MNQLSGTNDTREDHGWTIQEKRETDPDDRSSIPSINRKGNSQYTLVTRDERAGRNPRESGGPGARDMLACRSITEWTYKPSVELTGYTGPGHERRS